MVRNVSNYKRPEMYVWSKVKKQKERVKLRENNIMSRKVREKARLSIFFSASVYSVKDYNLLIWHQLMSVPRVILETKYEYYF